MFGWLVSVKANAAFDVCLPAFETDLQMHVMSWKVMMKEEWQKEMTARSGDKG